jgi:hypothetical protein
MTVIHQKQYSDFLRIVVMCRVKPMATGFTGIGAHTRQKKKKKGVFQRMECLLQQVFCFLNRLPNSGVKLC